MNSVQSGGSSCPRVSVIIPAYQTAYFIGETLESVLGQTFRDFEIIVINDGSPDTRELEVALQPYMSRIIYVKQENRGLPGARNLGVRLARGELLAFIDSDDIWMGDYLSSQVAFLDGHPQVHASIADALLFGACKETVWKMLKKGTSPILSFEQVLKRVGGQLPSATVVRRARFLQVGMFDEEMRIGEDVEFCVRLCCPDGSIGYLERVLVKYRQRPASLTADPGRRAWSHAEVRALHRLNEKLELSLAQRKLLADETADAEAAVALRDAHYHTSTGELAEAVRDLRIANFRYRKLRLSLLVACFDVFPQLAILLMNWRFKHSHHVAAD